MPLTAEQIEDLREQLTLARKRPLNFGLCVGGDAELTVLVAHRKKPADVLARAAKKQGGSSKVAFGTLRVEGKELILTCAEEPPAGTQRRTKDLLRAAGLKMKVTLEVRAPEEE